MSKAIRLTLLAPFALAWLCGSALAQGGVTNSTKNPKQIATLHWYEANVTTSFQVGTVPNQFGTAPTSVAFDGANIWVNLGGSLIKLRPSDGAVLATVNNLDGDCESLIYDGANLWTACFQGILSPILDKVRASDGAVIGRFSISAVNIDNFLAFDGANIWVPISSNLTPSSVVKVRASDGAVLGNFVVGSNGSALTSMVFDGANIWVANGGGNKPDNNVVKLRASDGAVLGTFSMGLNDPGRMAYDGANIWVGDFGDGTVKKLRPSDGAVLGNFFAGGVGIGPGLVAYDGANIWVTNLDPLRCSTCQSVLKLRASDGAVLGTFPVGSNPVGMVFDGANIWVASSGGPGVWKL